MGNAYRKGGWNKKAVDVLDKDWEVATLLGKALMKTLK
jgi:hypothetical protein